MTLAELAAAGRPAILVPFGAAAHGHQLENARAFSPRGAAATIEEAALTEPRLAGAIRRAALRPGSARRDGRGGAEARRAGRRPAPRRSAVRGGSGRESGMRFLRLRRLHFVGAGGVGMSGLAEILLLSTPLEISGCDLQRSENTDRLTKLGARIAYGHDASHVRDSDLLVISSAVGESNPEVTSARERGIPVIRRAEMLAEIMRLKQGVAIAGTHGKTTTTSLTGMVLTEAGFDPTIVVGGQVRILGTNARLGKGRLPRRRGGRVRPLVPRAHAGRRGDHERRGRPPRLLPRPRRHPRRVRDLRQPRPVLRRRGGLRGRRGRARDPAAHQTTRGDLRRVSGRQRARGRDPPGSLGHHVRSLGGERRGRSEACICGCPGGTTWRTRSRRSRSDASSRSRFRRSPARSRSSRASSAGSRRRASAAACSSSTTTRTIRPRSRPPSPRRGRSTRTGGSSRSSSRTSTRARATSRRTSGGR